MFLSGHKTLEGRLDLSIEYNNSDKLGTNYSSE